MIEIHWGIQVLGLIFALLTGGGVVYPLAVWHTNRQRDKQLADEHARKIEERKIAMAENAQALGAGLSVGHDLKIDGLPNPQPKLIEDSVDSLPTEPAPT